MCFAAIGSVLANSADDDSFEVLDREQSPDPGVDRGSVVAVRIWASGAPAR